MPLSVILWRTLEEALPTTMTGLYTKIILNILLRNIQKTETYKHINELSNFDDLPESLKESWLLLCKFAVLTRAKNQIVFSQQELSECFPRGFALDEKVLCFGMLQCTETVFETGRKTAFHFLHLTFQEYLATLYLTRLPNDKKLNLYSLIDAKYFSGALRFYFGNEKSESTDFGDQLIRSLNKRVYYKYSLLNFHFAFEAISQQLTDAVIRFLCEPNEHPWLLSSENYISYICNIMFESPQTAYDYAAMMYVMANLQESCKMSIRFSSANIGEKQIKTLANILSNRSQKYEVMSLDFNDNKVSDKSINYLFSRAPAAFTNSLTVLCLRGNNIGADGIRAITRALERAQSSKLLMLDLSKNHLGISGIQALEGLVCSGSLSNLVDLNLQESLMDSNSAVIGTFFEALSTNRHHLRLFDISMNPVQDDVPIMSALSTLVSQFSLPEPHLFWAPDPAVLKELKYSLRDVNISDRGLTAFANGLSNLSDSHCHLTWLDLISNGIQAVGILHLNGAKNLIIKHLWLGKNPLGLQGTRAVGELLSNNFGQLQSLSLNGCQLTIPCGDVPSINLDSVIVNVGKQLCQLPQNNTVTSLGLGCNCFTGPRIYILAGLIYLCSCLKDLYTSECGITSNDLRQLFDQLSQFKAPANNLQSWHLEHNGIDDDGICTLMDYLPSLFPSLLYVMVEDNQVSDEAETKMKDKVSRVDGREEEHVAATALCVSDFTSYENLHY